MEEIMALPKATQEMMEAHICSPASKMEAKMDAKKARMNTTLKVTEDMRAW
jgi:hypothetical protein